MDPELCSDSYLFLLSFISHRCWRLEVRHESEWDAVSSSEKYCLTSALYLRRIKCSLECGETTSWVVEIIPWQCNIVLLRGSSQGRGGSSEALRFLSGTGTQQRDADGCHHPSLCFRIEKPFPPQSCAHTPLRKDSPSPIKNSNLWNYTKYSES